MDRPTKNQLRHTAYDIALYVAIEATLAKMAHRLRYGRSCAHCGEPAAKHRPVRRFAGAVVHEIGAATAAGVYLRRQRVRVAVDRTIAGLEAHPAERHVRIPRQRHAHDELYAELDPGVTPSGR